MAGSFILQAFLVLNIFFIGVLVTIALQHAYAHFRPHPGAGKSKSPVPAVHLPPEVKEKLLQSAQANYQAILNKSADELQKDLADTAGQLNKQVEKLGHDILDNEMKRYQQELDRFRQQAGGSVSGAQADLVEHQNALKTKMTEEVTAQKELLLQQIDTKLDDAITSFLMEAMQHEVDLGAQSKYLFALLEEHKEDLKKELKG